MKYIIKNAQIPIGIVNSKKTSLLNTNFDILFCPVSKKIEGIEPTQKKAFDNISEKSTTINANNNLVLPGLIDLHTHTREPGSINGIKNETQAASKGGWTTLFAMPNTNPVVDNEYLAQFVTRKASEISKGVQVYQIGAITISSKGEQLTNMGIMHTEAGVNIFSDDGVAVANPLIMARALQYSDQLGVTIAQHAQDPTLTNNAQINAGELADRLGLKGWHSVAEEIIIARDIELARAYGGNLHICHVSTARGVELVAQAKKQGLNITAEVTSHHLTLTEKEIEKSDLNGIYKVNPPLRTKADCDALIEGLSNKTIDAIATDHAPHPTQKKEVEFQQAAFGITGLETALSVIYKNLIETKKLTLERFIDATCTKPSEIGRIKNNQIKVGEPANLIIFDAHKQWLYNETSSNGKNSPYFNEQLQGKVLFTVAQGKIAHQE